MLAGQPLVRRNAVSRSRGRKSADACRVETVHLQWKKVRAENQAAAAPRDVDELQDRLAAMCERLPGIKQITDRTVTRKAEAAERQATELRGQARRHATAADKLQEEKVLRLRLATEAPPSLPARHISAPSTSSRSGSMPPREPARPPGAPRKSAGTSLRPRPLRNLPRTLHPPLSVSR